MRLNILSIALIVSILLLSDCSEKEATESEKDRVERLLLSTTWEIDNVQIDGVEESNLFQSLTLKFAANSYTSTDGELVWKPSGTWQFNSDDGSTFIIDADASVTIDQISETSLTLSLLWDKDALGGGRTASISGQHVFTFVPQ